MTSSIANDVDKLNALVDSMADYLKVSLCMRDPGIEKPDLNLVRQSRCVLLTQTYDAFFRLRKSVHRAWASAPILQDFRHSLHEHKSGWIISPFHPLTAFLPFI